MITDPATQAITRFIGMFELAVEEFRLRQDYLKFNLKKPLADEDTPIPAVSVNLKIGFNIDPYDPGLAYNPVAPPAPEADHPAHYPSNPISVPLTPAARIADQPDPDPALADGPRIIYVSNDFPTDSPGSVVAVTIQIAALSDNDQFLDGLHAQFTDVAVLEAALDRIEAIADSLAGFKLPDMPTDADWIGFTNAVLTQFDAAEDIPTVGAAEAVSISVFRGDAADGIIVNGEAVDEAPEWQDLLPEYLRPDDAPATEDDDESSTSENPFDGKASDGETVIKSTSGVGEDGTVRTSDSHDFSRDFAGRNSDGTSAEPGNHVIAGANTAINEIAVGSQWIDAPVIVVRGDVAKVDAISQVNVLVEHDSIDGVPVHQDSVGHNIAEIVNNSSAKPTDTAPDASLLPSGWQLFRVDADLYQVNWVKQFTYVTDFDRGEVTFSGQATYLGLGENQIVNTAILNEFGYNFDLIFVGGDMIDATVVTQKNVLFDSDEITTGKPAGNVAVSTADAAAASAASLADNLLYNKATLTTTGVDQVVEMTEAFARTAAELAEGATSIAKDVTQDALFAGQEALRVLQIAGDLVKVNMFEQTNLVGDADQIRLEIAKLSEQFAAEAKMIAGSNALINLASVTEYGVDSKIMAGGTVYDDALIHQAEFFDTDATPNGVTMSGLTNDAVAAFLTDDVAQMAEMTDAIVPTGNHDSASHLDVMQTALT